MCFLNLREISRKNLDFYCRALPVGPRRPGQRGCEWSTPYSLPNTGPRPWHLSPTSYHGLLYGWIHPWSVTDSDTNRLHLGWPTSFSPTPGSTWSLESAWDRCSMLASVRCVLGTENPPKEDVGNSSWDGWDCEAPGRTQRRRRSCWVWKDE